MALAPHLRRSLGSRTTGLARQLAASAMAQPQQDSRPEFPFARPKAVDPPAEYARLRKECPVSKAKLFDGRDIWLITKLKDCQSVLKDNRFSKVRTHPGFPELVAGAKAAVAGRAESFVDMDPPEHTKYRGFFEHAFTKEAAEALRPYICSAAEELVNDMVSEGNEANLQEAFSLPFAYKVIYHILGIPFKDYDMLSRNIAMRSSASYTARDASAAQEQLVKYMGDLVERKERSPGKDLLSEVIHKHMKSGEIDKESLIAHAFLLVVAGNATVAGMINLGVITLLEHPDQLEALKKDPKLWPSAVQELCRFHTASAYALRRVALEDVKVGDQTIKKNEGIIALNQSANRDEEAFPDPDRFDIRRSPNPQIAYGSGTHECVAMPLALVELEVALSELFKHLPNLRLAVSPSQIKWSDPKGDVGVQELPVTW